LDDIDKRLWQIKFVSEFHCSFQGARNNSSFP
jgi:hypothetical protein